MRSDETTVDLVFVDISADVSREQELAAQDENFRGIAETIPVGLFRADKHGTVLYKNSMLDTVFGLEVTTAPPLDRVSVIGDERSVPDKVMSILESSDEGQIDLQFSDQGDVRFTRLRFRKVLSADGEVEVVGSAEDITTEVARQSQLELDALTDSVTGIPNRRSLEISLEQLLDGGHELSKFAVLLCDLDGFKQVNDSLGHDAGDAVIAEVGARLRACCREGDIVSRLGGDEFVVVARHVGTYDEAVEVGERLLPVLRQPFSVDGSVIEMSASIGVAVAAEDATVLSLLQMADNAMYEAKRSGRDQVRPYHSPDASMSLSPLALRRDLRRSIREGSLDLAFQPMYALSDLDSPVAAEALLRWNHPTSGYIPPSIVIPIAEPSGLIRDLGDWVLTEAIRATAEANAERDKKISISVNLSALQLGGEDFADSVMAALDFHDVAPSDVMLELTESYLIDSVDHARETIDRLDELGMRIAVDDFGTGYSSFDYLLSLPISAVKLDHSLTQRLETPRAAAMIRGIATACQELDMMLIAEGVETKANLEAVRDAGATHAQGYFLGRPVSLDGLGQDRRTSDIAA